MATGWQYANWMTALDIMQRRTALANHLAEIANRMYSFKTHRGLHTESERFELQKYWEVHFNYLQDLDSALGIAPFSDVPALITGKPRLEQAGPVWPDYSFV